MREIHICLSLLQCIQYTPTLIHDSKSLWKVMASVSGSVYTCSECMCVIVPGLGKWKFSRRISRGGKVNVKYKGGNESWAGTKRLFMIVWIWICTVRTGEYNHQRAKNKNSNDSLLIQVAKKVYYVSASPLNWDGLNKDSGWKSEVTFPHFVFSSISCNTKNSPNQTKHCYGCSH